MFRDDDCRVILCEELLHLVDLSSDASGRCASAEGSGAKFGVMMGRCVGAHDYGRYPSDQTNHERNVLAAGQSPRRDRCCHERSCGARYWQGVLSTSQSRGAYAGNAARHEKPRQGYRSYFAPIGPVSADLVGRGPFRLRARLARTAKGESPSARVVLVVSRRRIGPLPARSLRRAGGCNDSRAVGIDVRHRRRRLPGPEASPSGEERRRPTPPVTRKRPENVRESAYAKGKVRSNFPLIFKGGLITTP